MSAEFLATHSGLEVMQAITEGRLPFASIGQTMGFVPHSMTDGEAVFVGQPSAAHLNPMGGVHGGWYATILDSALGCAVHTKLQAGWGFTTAELSVNIVRAVTLTTGPLRATGRVLHCGRQLATAEGRIEDATGKLYAHGTTTCLVFKLQSQ